MPSTSTPHHDHERSDCLPDASTVPNGGADSAEIIAHMAERHTQVLRRWVVTRGGDPADAWDLVQEAFEKALHHKPQVGCDADLRAWLFVVLRRLFVDVHRASDTRTRAHANLEEHPAREEEPLPLWRQADLEMVREVLPRLAPRLREVFDLQLAGFSMIRIATNLGIPPATVGTRLYRARIRLRGLLLADRARPGE